MSENFKEQQQTGWNEKASAYDLHLGKITARAADPLLDAAGVGAGMQVLDVATGPGYVAGSAHARGAIATGIDIAGAMIAQAQRSFPDALFYEGDAESLIFPDGFFDAVLCPFGLDYLEQPEKAIGHAHRVLCPGGKYGFSVWGAPRVNPLIELIFAAIDIHGKDTLAKASPPLFRYSEPEVAKALLENHGFEDIRVEEVSLNWPADNPRQLLDLIYKSTVRTASQLECQDYGVIGDIHQHIIDGVQALLDHGEPLSWNALIAVATKPAS
ncbi:MAG TPA: hypothetical protein DCF62_00405 [Porticoccaceae bacterium]|nr:hypothetical protein [Porticoccaceae bacterium]HCO61496.1 hypothetical protein [Porticoccaceae bacterium]